MLLLVGNFTLSVLMLPALKPLMVDYRGQLIAKPPLMHSSLAPSFRLANLALLSMQMLQELLDLFF